MKTTVLTIATVFLIIIIVVSSCSTSDNSKKTALLPDELALLRKGEEIISKAQPLFFKTLSQAIRDTGIIGALSYCNLNAQGLPDALGIVTEGSSITRVSHKARNKENRLSGIDKIAIGRFEGELSRGTPPQPMLIPDLLKKEYVGYYPILIQGMCKNCHGIVEQEIDEDVYQAILELYPEDEAVNFFDGTLRGAWRVSFNVDPYSIYDYPKL